MQNKHRFLNQAIFVMSFILIAYSQVSQAGFCPGLENSAPTFPSIRAVEIANPQAPAKPFMANSGATGPTDLRALMALQGETIDLIYTLTETIPSGCIYKLQILRNPRNSSRVDNSSLLKAPIEAILKPEILHSSERTIGDNRIIFKIAPAPQVGADKIHTLYASFVALNTSYFSEEKPFKFKNIAYNILKVIKEPYSYNDSKYSINGYTLNITLNALPTQALARSFYLDFIQNEGSRNSKLKYQLNHSVDLQSHLGVQQRTCREGYVKSNELSQCATATILDNKPTVLTHVNNDAGVRLELTYLNENISADIYHHPECLRRTNHLIGFCAPRETYVAIP